MRRDRPSFTDEIKGELAGLQPAKPCCKDAELDAVVRVLAAGRNSRVRLRVPRNPIARAVVQLARDTGGQVHAVRKGTTERRPSYAVELSLGPPARTDGVCCARAALRGLFLARGVIAEPGSAYHLEIAVPPAEQAATASVLERLRLPTTRLHRRGRAVFYFKGAEAITRSLGLMGANRAVVRFEHDRIVRDMRGNANRRANSETANMDKRLRVAFVQVEAVRKLQHHDRSLQSLSPALQATAELRLAHPHASLQTLATHAQVSKSAVAHRLRRLLRLARENGLLD